MKTVLLPLALLLSGAIAAHADTNLLQLTKHIQVPNIYGRFDHMAADPASQRLYVAALENNTLEVIDLKAGKHLDTIRGMHKPAGVAFLPDQNRICIANGEDATCKLYDAKTLDFISQVENLDDADNVRYDAKTKLIYVGFGGGELAVLDFAKTNLVAEIPLKAHPESFVLETQGPRIFVNLPDRKQIAVVDRDKRAISQVLTSEKLDGNFPIAFDEKNQRLFIGCRKPARLRVFDTKAGTDMAEVPIPGDIDDLFFDATNKRLYASCGAGYISVISQLDADHYKPVKNIPTAAKARTSLFIPELKILCVAVPAQQGKEAQIYVYEVH